MKLTGSGFGRAKACPPSTFLPRVESTGSEYAKRGKAVHDFLLMASKVGREAALELVELKHRDTCAAIDLDAMPHANSSAWAFEVAFALNLEAATARELWRGHGGRNYGDLQPGEIPGTADVIGYSEVGGLKSITVLDVKTGHGEPDPLQLAFYAVAAGITYGAEEATVGWIRLTDGTPRYSSRVVNLVQLLAELRDIVLTAEEQELEYQVTGVARPVEGDHCCYCPAYAQCPAKATLLGELVREATSPQELPVLTPETAPQAWLRQKAAEKMLERTDKWLREYARAHPFTLPDGKTVGAVETSEETIIAKKAEAVLPPEIYADAAETETTLTKAALERAAKKHLPEGKKITHFVKELLEQLRAAGAVSVTKSVEVRAFKPKELP